MRIHSFSRILMLVGALAACTATAVPAHADPGVPRDSTPTVAAELGHLETARDGVTVAVLPAPLVQVERTYVVRVAPDSVARTHRLLVEIDSATEAARARLAAFTSSRLSTSRTSADTSESFPGDEPVTITMAMAALAAARNTKRRAASPRAYKVGAGKKIHQGSIVVLSGGYAEAGTTALNKTYVGMATETVDNTAGAAGDVMVTVESGVDHLFANDGTITQANVGSPAYIVDDQTVAAGNGGNTRSAAGIIRGVDAAGVWVES